MAHTCQKFRRSSRKTVRLLSMMVVSVSTLAFILLERSIRQSDAWMVVLPAYNKNSYFLLQHQQQRDTSTTLYSTTQKKGKKAAKQQRKIIQSPTSSTSGTTTSQSTSVITQQLSVASTSSRSSNRQGDARGAALLLENVNVFRGPAQILRNIDWRIEPGTKWAIVGENGAGKSTLLKAIVGEIPITEGSVSIGTPLDEVGYLQQTAVAGSNRTIYEEAASGMVEIQQAAAAMEHATSIEDWEALEVATSRFEALGGYQQEQTVGTVLKGLGFSPDSYHTMKCTELSGGWQMRVAFARQLLRNPSLSLLDEPGNHLDAAARSWLAKYLSDYDGTGSMILVTHDVELLKSMDHICEIIPGASGVQIYKSCNYEQYLALKEERAAAAIAEYERNAEKAAKLQAFVDRFGASATKASAAQSRVKQLEKMQDSGLLDAPPDAIIAQTFKPTMKFPFPPKAVGATLLSIENGCIGYHEDKILVNNVNIEITKGMKLLIRGPNGAGKSTCLHTIRGTLPLLGGKRIASPDLRLGMFTQDLAQELDVKARAVDIVTAYARTGIDGDITVSDQDARSAMGRLGLRNEKPLRKIGDLSGGEKARVALAMFALKPSNVYCLDEPSNHLDAACVEALSDALSEWGGSKGAIVVVSHDRNFCDKITFTHVATVQDGTFTLEERPVRESDWYVQGMEAAKPSTIISEDDDDNVRQQVVNGSTGSSSSSTTQPKKELDPKLRKAAFNAPKRIKKLESMIADYEKKIVDIDNQMSQNGNDVALLMELNNKKQDMQDMIDSCLKEWNELEELLAQVAAAN